MKADGIDGPGAPIADRHGRAVAVTGLGIVQILAWGSSYYLLAVLAEPIARDTGWAFAWVVGALSIGLLVAGLVAPTVGHAIELHGGRPILAASAVLLSAGLGLLAVSPNLAVFVLAWVVVGLGMGAGLYDAAFSTLGRLYGLEARRFITWLTLFGGFASTACWPLTAFFETQLGWRGTCAVYAVIQIGICLPLILITLPQEAKAFPRTRQAAADASPSPPPHDPQRRRRFLLVTSAFTITSMIASVISVHLLTMLQSRGVTLAAAVALGSLIGPSQVGARVVEMLFGRRHHPVWTMIVSTALIAAGLGALLADLSWVSAAIMLYGCGMGIKSIVRGSVPLVVVGAEGYASLMGRIAMPALLLGAVSPFLGAIMLDRFGVDATLVALTVAAVISLGLSLMLVPATRPTRTLSI